jgi:hypothetical protein
MDNVTILASEPIMVANPLAVTLAVIGVGIMVVALFLILILRNCTIPIIIAAIGVCLSIGALGWACIDQVEDYVQYSVLISDDANFKEIYEKYEILEVKGEIYEVKEIEADD